ncbi:MAG: Sec-independent protein translocase protein TatB [Thermodesulfobacteriota bacterium]|nr:Sec-independent protein translocase protein TatB [Thermodesulfobacteriota bacterium]
MFGIGLPEMIVILAVALIVVGPDKLPELARSLAKGISELKNTMNQVKENLSEETKVISSVQEDLRKTAGQLTDNLLDNKPKIWNPEDGVTEDKDVEEEDVIDLQPLEERPWEEDAQAEPENREEGKEKREKEKASDDTTDHAVEITATGSPESTEEPADSSTKDTPTSPAA